MRSLLQNSHFPRSNHLGDICTENMNIFRWRSLTDLVKTREPQMTLLLKSSGRLLTWPVIWFWFYSAMGKLLTTPHQILAFLAKSSCHHGHPWPGVLLRQSNYYYSRNLVIRMGANHKGRLSPKNSLALPSLGTLTDAFMHTLRLMWIYFTQQCLLTRFVFSVSWNRGLTAPV